MKRVFAHIGFSVAVAMIMLNLCGIRLAPVISAGLAVLFTVSLVCGETRKGIAFPLCLGSAFFASLVFIFVWQMWVEPAAALDGKEALSSFYIIDLPDFANGRYKFTAKLVSVAGCQIPKGMKIRLWSPSIINCEPYRIISANLSFSKTGQSAFSSNGLWGDNLFVRAKIDEYTLTDIAVNSPLRYSLTLKKSVIETLTQRVGGSDGAVAAAVLTGDKTNLPFGIYSAFLYSGTNHVMAVSGLHLAVLTGAAGFVLNHLGLSRRPTMLILILLTLSYMATTGFSKSIVRAGIMLCVVFGAQMFGRHADTLNSLGIAVLIICINPFAVSDAGAVLSVLSVFSLTTVFKSCLAYKKKFFANGTAWYADDFKRISSKVLFAVADTFLVAFSVVLCTIPAAYLFFGSVRLTGIFANMVMVPVASLVTVASFAAYACCKLSVLTTFSTTICRAVCHVTQWLALAFSKMPHLSIFPGESFAVIISAALLFAAAYIILFKAKKHLK